MSARSSQPVSVAAVGELAALEGYALAGVAVHAAETADEVLQQWAALPPQVGVVLLTPRSAAALGRRTELADAPMTVVLPA